MTWLWDFLDGLYAWIFPQHRNDVIAVLDAEIDSLGKEHNSFAKLLKDNAGGDTQTPDFFSRHSDLTREYTATLARVAGEWPARKEVREAYVEKLVELNRELRDHLVKLGAISAPEAETVTRVGDGMTEGDVRRRRRV